MTIPRKSDSLEVVAHIRSLKAELWLGRARAWWPDCLFRFDHIEAAAKILNSGKLLSRAAAREAGVMWPDCASPSVIACTDEHWQGYTRLYFKPKSPTQFDSEGFRPADMYHLGACCPVPIVLLFDAEDVLTRASTRFTDGNLARNPEVGDDASFLRRIPFKLVYHDTWFQPSERDKIIFHRHAEVIVPNELDLLPLRFVGSRTQAEYETLLNLLQPAIQRRWSGRIGLGTAWNLHYRRWTFVEQVDLGPEAIVFKFNPSSETTGPFVARVDITEDATGQRHYWESRDFEANSNLELKLASLSEPKAYTVRFTLDDALAYAGRFQKSNKPV